MNDFIYPFGDTNQKNKAEIRETILALVSQFSGANKSDLNEALYESDQRACSEVMKDLINQGKVKRIWYCSLEEWRWILYPQ